MQDPYPHTPKLNKAPLQEVIFEALWSLDIDPQTRENWDPGFDLAQGVFAKHMHDKFPVRKRIAPPLFPPHLLNHKPIHQFWRGEGQWPVIQLGPGILAVNDTEKTYVWETAFKPLVEYGLDTLQKSYAEELRFEKSSLRYIDAFEMEGNFKGSFTTFIEENLQLRVHKGFAVPGTIRNQSIVEAYSIEDGSLVHFAVSDGLRNNNAAVILQIVVTRERQSSIEDIKLWLSNAHTVTSTLFKDILRKEFYVSLK